MTSYTFEEVDSLQSVAARPIVVFIQADWCKYCKIMENTTLQDPTIIKVLQEKFYFISFDGEEERDILFREHTFRFKPRGQGTGVHELAEQLGTIDGQLSYPTICILNEKEEIVFQYTGFLKAKVFRKILYKI